MTASFISHSWSAVGKTRFRCECWPPVPESGAHYIRLPSCTCLEGLRLVSDGGGGVETTAVITLAVAL